MVKGKTTKVKFSQIFSGWQPCHMVEVNQHFRDQLLSAAAVIQYLHQDIQHGTTQGNRASGWSPSNAAPCSDPTRWLPGLFDQTSYVLPGSTWHRATLPAEVIKAFNCSAHHSPVCDDTRPCRQTQTCTPHFSTHRHEVTHLSTPRCRSPSFPTKDSSRPPLSCCCTVNTSW